MAAAAALQAAVPTAGHASACNEDIVARISFKQGATCWAYQGNATSFVGSFAAGQRIVAFMRGQAADYDPKSGRTVISVQNRVPDVTGPGGFSTGGEFGSPTLAFTTPKAGSYRLSFSPCAMWGAPGTVRICTK